MKFSLALLALVAFIATGEAKKIKAVAKYSTDVALDDKGRIAITLDGSASEPSHTGCLLYEWGFYIKGEKKWKVISRSAVKVWTVEKDCKNYKFYLRVWDKDAKYEEDKVTFKVEANLKCDNNGNNDGGDNNDDGDEGNLGAPKPRPCKEKPVAVAEVSKITKTDEGFLIKLDASASENCDDYIWYNLDDPDYLGDGMKDKYVATSGGQQEFRLECVKDCGNKMLVDSTIVKAYIEECNDNPCESMEASFTVSNEDDKCEFVLDASESVGCKQYEWTAYQEGGSSVVIPGGKKTTFKPEGLVFGDFKFFLKCIDGDCVKKARKSGYCKDPCLDIKAEASVSGTSNCKFELDASLSVGCQDYEWKVSHEGGQKEIISDQMTDVYKPDTHGEFKFFLTCTSEEGCVKKDKAVSECGDPCDELEVKAAISIDNVYTNDGGNTYQVELSGKDSEDCKKYTWYRPKKGSWKEIGQGKEIVYTAYNDAPYTFKLVCENNKDDCDAVATTTHTTPCLGKLARKFKNYFG